MICIIPIRIKSIRRNYKEFQSGKSASIININCIIVQEQKVWQVKRELGIDKLELAATDWGQLLVGQDGEWLAEKNELKAFAYFNYNAMKVHIDDTHTYDHLKRDSELSHLINGWLPLSWRLAPSPALICQYNSRWTSSREP